MSKIRSTLVGSAIVLGVLLAPAAPAFAEPGAAIDSGSSARDFSPEPESADGPRDVGASISSGSATFNGGAPIQSGNGPRKPAPPIRAV